MNAEGLMHATVTIDRPLVSPVAARAAEALAKQEATLRGTTELLVATFFDTIEKRPAVAGDAAQIVTLDNRSLRNRGPDARFVEAATYGLTPYLENPASFTALSEGVRAALGEGFGAVSVTNDGSSITIAARGKPGETTSTALTVVDKDVVSAIATITNRDANAARDARRTFKTLSASPEMKAVWKLIATRKSGTKSIQLLDNLFLRPDGKPVDSGGRKYADVQLAGLDLAKVRANVASIYDRARNGVIPETQSHSRFLWWYTN